MNKEDQIIIGRFTKHKTTIIPNLESNKERSLKIKYIGIRTPTGGIILS